MDGPIFVVFTNPKEGGEDEYNEWYTNTHLDDVLKVDGFKAAQRFVLADTEHAKTAPYRYLAIYEGDEGKMELAIESLAQAGREGRLPGSAAVLDPDRKTWWYVPITEHQDAP